MTTAAATEKYIDAGVPPDGATLKASRLLRCPQTGDWCDSQCSYRQHASPWKELREHPIADVEGFLAGLRRDLGRGENRTVDVSRYDAPDFDGWRWIDRAEDLDTREKVDIWIAHLHELLASNRRLRLYGDDHDVRVA